MSYDWWWSWCDDLDVQIEERVDGLDGLDGRDSVDGGYEEKEIGELGTIIRTGCWSFSLQLVLWSNPSGNLEPQLCDDLEHSKEKTRTSRSM